MPKDIAQSVARWNLTANGYGLSPTAGKVESENLNVKIRAIN